MTLAILAFASRLTYRSLRYRDTVLTATPARSATVAMFGFRFIGEPARDFIRKHDGATRRGSRHAAESKMSAGSMVFITVVSPGAIGERDARK